MKNSNLLHGSRFWQRALAEKRKGSRRIEGKHCHNYGKSLIHYKKTVYEGISLKGYIEERAINIANYIIEENATVRQTAKKFGISKSTVHTVVTK